MNIFVLDSDPWRAARCHCDLHVPKMLLESAQLLCNAVVGHAPYRRSHFNHPCSRWARSSTGNFIWLLALASALSHEHLFRFGTFHKSIDVVVWAGRNIPSFDKDELTPFVQVMPEQFRMPDPVEAYRAYYRTDKSRFAKWERGRPRPEWYGEG